MGDRKMQDWKWRTENGGPKMQGWKMQDWKMRDQFNFVNWIEETPKFAVHRCVTIIILCCSNVFNVPLKSAKTHSSNTDSAKNIEHVAVSGEHSQNHIYWRAAQWTPISHSSNLYTLGQLHS